MSLCTSMGMNIFQFKTIFADFHICIFQQGRSPAVKLKLKKPKNDKKVQWQEGTVDNEFMDKKKSKCKQQ